MTSTTPRRATLIVFCIALAFVLGHTLSFIAYFRGQYPNVQQQRSCEQEMKKFWNTPVPQFKLLKSNRQCIRGKSNDGLLTPGLENLLIPANFKNFPKCKSVTVNYYQKPHPKVALASFPGSGNTWARHLIEYMSGIYTGSVYCGIVKEEFKAECDHDKHNYTIVIKTHQAKKLETFDRAVLIIRNPYDALFAEFNRQKAGKTGTVNVTELNSEAWNDWVAKRCQGWRIHIGNWVAEFNKSIHILSYEELKNNFFREMYRLASFLNVNMTYSRLWCLKKNSEGSYHRKKTLNPIYSAENRQRIDDFIAEVKTLVREKYHVELPFKD